MEENKNIAIENATEQEEKSLIDFQKIYQTLILNWKWFVLSLLFCLSAAAIYLRYTTPIYQAYAKLIIKEESGSRSRGALMNTMNFGTISNTSGIETEIEILQSRFLAEQTVRDLKLYTTYKSVGKVSDNLLYQNQPITVDIDPAHLEKITGVINLEIDVEKDGYHVSGNYGNHTFNKLITKLPASFQISAGTLTFTQNSIVTAEPGSTFKVQIMSPKMASYSFACR